MKRIIDITNGLFECEPYPGDPAPEKFSVKSVSEDGYSLTAFYACVHNATHIDAPSHFLLGGEDVCSVDLQKCMGKCYVSENIESALSALNAGHNRIIFKGFNITTQEAKLFSKNSVLLGMDGSSFGKNDNSSDVHRDLLSKGIVLLENLDLSNAPTGEYELIALPLKLSGSDGSPVRAVLIKNET